jgi:hypothetical protein
VQVDPIKPTLKPPGTERLTLKCDTVLSSFAFNFSLRRFSEEALALASEVMFARLPPPRSVAAAAAADLQVRPSFDERLKARPASHRPPRHPPRYKIIVSRIKWHPVMQRAVWCRR